MACRHKKLGVHVEHFFSSHVFTNYQFTFALSAHTHTLWLWRMLFSCELKCSCVLQSAKMYLSCFKMKGAFFWYGRRACAARPVMEIPLLIISPPYQSTIGLKLKRNSKLWWAVWIAFCHKTKKGENSCPSTFSKVPCLGLGNNKPPSYTLSSFSHLGEI